MSRKEIAQKISSQFFTGKINKKETERQLVQAGYNKELVEKMVSLWAVAQDKRG